MKNLRKTKARACPVHISVLDKAGKELANVGYFSKDEIITQLGFEAMSESIRWDYIREFLQEDYDIQLVPLAERFFKAYVKDASGNRVKTSDERKIRPEKYLATGYGKKTAGFASVALDEGQLALKRLTLYKAVANGAGKAFEQYMKALRKRKVIGKEEKVALLKQG